MVLLLIRVLVAPLLVAGGSLAQRRWGLTVGGRLIGLPLTSIPLLALMTWSDGDEFAARAAAATLAGGVAASAWCLAYAITTRRLGPLGSLSGASAVFALVAVALDHVDVGPIVAALLCAMSVVGALALWPRSGPVLEADDPVDNRTQGASARAELPVRMAVAAAFTFGVSELAGSLGARPAGLVGSLPVLTVVLAVATHRRGGPGAANRFLRGVVAGSWSLVTSLAVLALALPALGAAIAFPAAIAVAVLVQLLTSRVWHLPSRAEEESRPATTSQLNAV